MSLFELTALKQDGDIHASDIIWFTFISDVDISFEL